MKLEDYIKKNKEQISKETISSGVDRSFEMLLQQELHQAKPKQNSQWKYYLTIAACFVVIAFAGFWFQNTGLNTETQNQLLAKFNDESAGKRLEGVYEYTEDVKKEDSRIINRLIQIVLEDDNANVKIASIDALLQFPKNENIRTSLIEALEKETEPLVQIKLIKAISFLRENRAQKSLEKIINNQETFPIVKNNATLAINTLNQ